MRFYYSVELSSWDAPLHYSVELSSWELTPPQYARLSGADRPVDPTRARTRGPSLSKCRYTSLTSSVAIVLYYSNR